MDQKQVTDQINQVRIVIFLMQVGNLGLLFLLMFFIFAALGMELFGHVGKL